MRFLPFLPSLVGDMGSVSLDGMVDDSYRSATDFDSMFEFLHKKFFPRCTFDPIPFSVFTVIFVSKKTMTSAGNPNRVALNRRASAPSTTTFSPWNRVFAIQNYGTACRLSCAPRNTEIGMKQRASGRGVAEEDLQEEETPDHRGKR
jgi:hypothetical protein